MKQPENRTMRGVSVFSGRVIEIEIKDARIHAVHELDDAAGSRADSYGGPASGTGAPLPFISPGFFDIQVNGFHGSDYSLDEFSEQDMRSIHRHLVASGTTQHIPTIVTSPQERFLRNLSIISDVVERDPVLREAIPGIHIEGPYLSGEDGPRGAHDSAYIRDPDYSEFQEWQAAAGNRIVMVTLAPERSGAIPFIERLAADGVCVAIGHTGADPDTIRKAVAAGARVSTHLGNGSHAVVPRLKNYVWEQLAQDGLYAGIICDGFHLPPAVVKVFQRAKGLSRLILVSDVALLGGKEPGVYKWGNIDVEVFPDGHLGLPGTTMLAGAAHLLDWDIAHFHRYTGIPLGEVIRLCTTNPALLLGLGERITTEFQVGAPANLVEFIYSGVEDRLRVHRTVAGGREVFRHDG